MTPTVEQLIDLARRALEKTPEIEEGVSLIEDYTEAFAALQNPETGELPNDLDPEQLEILQDLHTAVLRKAHNYKQSTSSDMVHLRKRGKGLKSYIDTLPKSISRRRPRKG